MDNRHLWLRSKRQHAILRVRHAIIKAVRDFFDERGFTLVDAPIFTPNACEGTSNALRDRLPRRQGVPDAVRAALHGGGRGGVRQASTASGPRSAPRRARRAGTSPSSGWSSPRSRSWTSTATCVSPRTSSRSSSGACSRRAREELKVARARHDEPRARRARPSRASRTPRRSTLLQKNGHPEAKVGDDFGGDEETVICDAVRPPGHRAPLPDGPEGLLLQARRRATRALALNMDVLAPEGYGEIVGGGQREDDLDEARGGHRAPQAAARGVRVVPRRAPLRDASRTRASASGIERTVAWICGLPHVRETIPFPRMLNRLSP